MTGLALIAGLSAALAVLGVLLAVIWLRMRQREQRILRRLVADQPGVAEDEGRLLQLLGEQGERIDALFDEDGESQRLFVQAGLRQADRRMIYFAVQAVLPVVAALAIMIAAFVRQDLSLLWLSLLAFTVLALGMLLPRIWLRARAAARRRRIAGEVPMFIHILAMLFDAGLSLRQALGSLVRDGRNVLPELGFEMTAVLRQIEAGEEPATALQNTARALQITQLSAVLDVLRQVDKFGGELRTPLMEVLAVVEQNRSLSLREKVNALSGRMTVVMVLFFFPALLIFVAGPAMLSIMSALGSR